MADSGAPANTAPAPAPARTKRFRTRSNYFLPGDLVWVHPARLPYWPAEVIESNEAANRVRARLLHPPEATLLEANLTQERRVLEHDQQRAAAKLLKKLKREEKNGAEGGPSTRSSNSGAQTSTLSAETPAAVADVVTTTGLRTYFFDKLNTPEEVEECVEERLQRKSYDVSAYEAAFYKAVLHANRFVRIALSPEKLKPYSVCGIGVVHSLMRSHVHAPRQPNTDRFTPQTAVIRLRVGMENALRDLRGFDYIWVLFQFSYAAAMATGQGQSYVRHLQEHAAVSDGDAVAIPEEMQEARRAWRRRQGVANSLGFKTMVVPPRDEELRGVLATRSPHRPNFIGLSCVQLVDVRGLDVHIADHDLLHGTPVLDIKPYLPFCDAHPDAKAGWVTELEASGRDKGDHKYAAQLTQVDRVLEDVSATPGAEKNPAPQANS